MDVFRFRWRFLVSLLVGLAVINLLIVKVFNYTAFPDFHGGTGDLENLQLLALLVAMLAFGGIAYKARDADRLIAIVAFAVCTLFFFRSFESKSLTSARHPVLDFMSDDPILYVLTVLFAVIISVQFHLNRRHLPAFLDWLMRLEWWPFLLAGVVLILSFGVDMLHRKIVFDINLEETLELNGFFIIAAAAVASLWRTLGRHRS